MYHLEATLSTGGQSLSATSSPFAIAPPPAILDTTKVVATADSSGGRVTVSGAATKLDSGTVVVGQKGDGFIREILGVQSAGTTTVYKTRPASLNQLIQNGSLSSAVGISSRARSNVSRLPSPNAPLPAIEIPLKGQLQGTGITLSSLSGSSTVSVTTGADFDGKATIDLSIKNFKTETFAYSLDGTFTLSGELKSKLIEQFSKDSTLPPIVVFHSPQVYFIGPVPVVVVFEGRFELEGKLNAGASLEFGVQRSITRDIKLGVKYDGATWQKTSNISAKPSGSGFSFNALASTPISLTAGLVGRFVVGAALYDLAEVYAYAGTGFLANASVDLRKLQLTTACNLSASIGAGLGASRDAKNVVNALNLPFALDLPSLQYEATLASIDICPTTTNISPTLAVEVSPPASRIALGTTIQLSATPKAAWFGSTLPVDRPVQWRSDDPAVASVDQNGLVQAISLGSTLIRATSDGREGVASIDVERIATPSQLTVAPLTLSFSATASGSVPAAQSIAVTNSGGGSLGSLGVSVEYGSGPSGWLNASIAGQAAPTTALVQPATALLTPGTYTATVKVFSGQANVVGNPQQVVVTYRVIQQGPTVRTLSPTNIGVQGFDMNGSINPNGAAAQAYFEWGTSPGLTTFQFTTVANLGAGVQPLPLVATLTGLTCATKYYYRAVGLSTNGGSAIRGTIDSATTTACPPQGGTIQVSNVLTGDNQPAGPFTIVLDSATSARVSLTMPRNGTVAFTQVKAGLHTVTFFGPGIGVGTNCTVRGLGTQNVSVVDAQLTSTTFTVDCLGPTATSDVASNITDVSITLTGAVTPRGGPSIGYFEWGTSASLATFQLTTANVIGSGLTPVAIQATLSGLVKCTSYYYRAVALPSNGGAAARGSIVSATTTGCSPTTGNIQVGAALSGSNIPSGPFSVTLDAQSTSPVTLPISANGSVSFSNIPAGAHDVRLTGSGIGTNTNCPISGGFSQSVNVVGGQTTHVSFVMTCAAPSATTLSASNVSVSSLDMNGSVNPSGGPTNAYFEWGTSSTLSTFQFTTTSSLGSGTAGVPVVGTLTGLASCTTYYYRVVALPLNGGTAVRGGISSATTLGCPTSGSIDVSNAITGVNMPAGPFTAVLDASSATPIIQSIPKNGTVTFANVPPGSHDLRLTGSGIGPNTNCSIAPGFSVPIVVTVGQTATVVYTITCVGPSAATTSATNIGQTTLDANGSINPNGGPTQGYFEWGTSPSLTTFQFTTVANVGSGTSPVPAVVTLNGLVCNTPYYYRIVALPTNGGTAVRGAIVSGTTAPCPILPGSIQVSNLVTGSNDPAGPFSVTLDATSPTPTTLQIPKNGSVSFPSVSAGAHELRLTGSGIGTNTNCAISGGFIQNVTVNSGAVTNVPYAITCAAPGAVSNPATGITQTGFTMNGDLQTNGGPTRAYFEWGTSSTLATFQLTTATGIFASGTVAVSANMTAMSCGTTYYYRLVALPTNNGTAIRGAIIQVSTLACSPTTGSIQVSNQVSGTNDPAGPFSVTLDASQPNPVVLSISKNGSVTFPNVLPGLHELRLTGQGIGTNTNCTIAGGFIQTPSVVAGQTTNATYSISCVPPSVSSLSASSISQTAFDMNGSINPNGGPTQGYFEWGTSSTLATFQFTTAGNIGSGTSAVPIIATLGSLACGTTYYYRAVALPTNSGGALRGSIVSAQTNACTPTTGSIQVSNSINGANQPNGPFSVTLDATSSNPTVLSIAKNGTITFTNVPTGLHDVRLTGSGIGPNTNCSIAPNFIQNPTVSGGQTTNVIYTISCVAPSATTQSATNVQPTAFDMNGSVNPNGGPTQGYFEWGTSSTLSTFQFTTTANLGSGTSGVPVVSTLNGLVCGTPYFYRVVALPMNGGSAVRGSILSATPGACATGTITVSTSFSGTNQPAGPFSVTLDALASNPTIKSIAKNGSVSFTNVSTGAHELRLTGSGIGTGSNCTITGGFIKNVTVNANQTTAVTYSVVCQ